MSFGIQLAKSLLSVLSTTNWYCVRLTAESMVMSCIGCMYRVMPTTSCVSRSRRRMISLAVAWRSACCFKLIRKRPLFKVELAPSTPMNELRDCTSGSLQNRRGECLLALRHGGVRDGLRRLGYPLNLTGILNRERSPSG